MILVFAGAGASYAINKDKYPTTVEFYKRLDKSTIELMDKALSGILSEHIRNYENTNKKPVDIEKVLFLINEVSDWMNKCKDTENIVGDSVHRIDPSVYNFVNQYMPDVEILEDTIYRKIYDFYGGLPEESDTEIWKILIRKLKSISRPIEIFTTNYDLVLDEVSNDNSLNIENGIVLEKYNSTIDIRYLDDTINPSYGRLIKLHGSVNWQRQYGKVISGSNFFTGDHDNHVIIYPSYKSEPDDWILKQFHDHLIRVSKETTIAIFVGFSFRDNYINQILRHIPEDAKKIIINLDKMEDTYHEEFPFRVEECQHFDKGFSPDIAGSILNFIGF